MIETIVKAVALALDMLDQLYKAAAAVGVDKRSLDELVAEARKRRAAQIAADRKREMEG